MKIELIYDGDGNLTVIKPDGGTVYFFCEYSVPDDVLVLLEDIPKYPGGGPR